MRQPRPGHERNRPGLLRDRDDLIFSYRKTNIVAPFILSVTFAWSRTTRTR